MDVSRRDMFKQVLNKESLQMLSILLPGRLEYLLGIGSRRSAEKAALALGKRRWNRSPKLTWNTSLAEGGECKAAPSEDAIREKGGDA